MKKNILYLGIAGIIGLLGGYLIFGNSSGSVHQKTTDVHAHSEVVTTQMWTCSMHPQIRQPEPGTCPICAMELIPAEAGANGLGANQIKMTENAMALANIETTSVGNLSEGNTEGLISLSGKITANNENTATQASYFDGRLEKLNVSFEGQEVKRGQLLATIYAPNLVAAQQELITAASLKESQPALYTAVRNKLKLWKLSADQIDTIESTGKVRENFPVYATVSGTVALVMAAEGDYIKQGQPILKVSNLTSVWAEFDVYENQISQFKKGQKITVSTSAYPELEFDAVISFIDPVLNSSTRTVTIRTTLKNKKNLFKPGMFVTGKIKNAGHTTGEELNIPASAVLWTGERSLVYVKPNPNEAIFEMREVTVGLRKGTTFTVISGLEKGAEIVTNGAFTVDAAAQLQGKKSMMNRSGGSTMTGHEGHAGMHGAAENIPETIVKKEMRLSKAFQTDFQAALKPYLKMKEAFVASDASQVAAAAKTAFEKMKTLEVADLGKVEKSYLSKSIETLDAISSHSDLKHQRAQLVVLNEYLTAIALNIEAPFQTLYVQRCPMSNSNKGAVWLSTDKEIKNPYYGAAMLTCGTVIEEIK